MAARQSLRSAVLVLIAFSLEATYVMPARAVDTLGAAYCCAMRCHHAQTAASASRCCHVKQDGTDVSALSTVKRAHPDVTSAPLFIPPTTIHLARPIGNAPPLTLRTALPAAPLY